MANTPRKLRINLALQGGGAHGAFTWGVLDRLLQEDDIEIGAISGTSAGALNGAALKAGWVKNGAQGARDNLDWLWTQVSGVEDLAQAAWMAPFGVEALSRAMEYSWPVAMADAVSNLTSPYSYGPFYRNPLKDIVAKFDFDRVCNKVEPHLHICATRVRNGKIKVFSGDEISADAIMASACLPTLFQAVEIYDPQTDRVEPFWDGGYTGNPALFPLFDDALPADIVIININPLEREDLPVTPKQIQNRINEISFNSSLLRELRAIDFVQRLLDEGRLPEDRMHRVRVHMIADDALMAQLSVVTKSVPNAAVIAELKQAGYAAAERFLSDHKDQIGKESSVNLREMFA
ncbi:patatin-like phospholipase family protein [Sulfitobacter sp. M57]|uniref:patatin-like phospholipase family protein n=1 Tax=unclassified Sulfitobacter TaxID=196795 RepID=UPI0023E30723|nr:MULTISPECIES: patatin-like phospholipase family protein [unclassified Sulfitobacter]MDF3413790.1 patatin-like phospholipase family protein [Sulfitobacter sp. KE5]MDF3420929.1 patatin-like phospholipase family protein [Sulfitobacter sp. KE43]MDF3432336.1 patatin-like phospholipase family protein [Sulfitobacter sp. KE42]MDF3457975.1 patatin-like phospholipase family protein [Sulfitobacter sp. S74]MDF3461876.1 patatin-like phospholipase family protein [Sulfitobacter sp. Ks18]